MYYVITDLNYYYRSNIDFTVVSQASSLLTCSDNLTIVMLRTKGVWHMMTSILAWMQVQLTVKIQQKVCTVLTGWMLTSLLKSRGQYQLETFGKIAKFHHHGLLVWHIKLKHFSIFPCKSWSWMDDCHFIPNPLINRCYLRLHDMVSYDKKNTKKILLFGYLSYI